MTDLQSPILPERVKRNLQRTRLPCCDKDLTLSDMRDDSIIHVVCVAFTFCDHKAYIHRWTYGKSSGLGHPKIWLVGLSLFWAPILGSNVRRVVALRRASGIMLPANSDLMHEQAIVLDIKKSSFFLLRVFIRFTWITDSITGDDPSDVWCWLLNLGTETAVLDNYCIICWIIID